MRPAHRARLRKLGLTSCRQLRLMLFQALGEAATTGVDAGAKVLQVASTGVSHLLHPRGHGVNSGLTRRRELGLMFLEALHQLPGPARDVPAKLDDVLGAGTTLSDCR
jgi:hypothetical protein